MMAAEVSLVWLRAKDIIKNEVNNDQTFNIWFAPIKFVSLAQDTLTLMLGKLKQEDIYSVKKLTPAC